MRDVKRRSVCVIRYVFIDIPFINVFGKNSSGAFIPELIVLIAAESIADTINPTSPVGILVTINGALLYRRNLRA